MESKPNTYFQIRNLSPPLRRGIKVAAAMEGMTMEDWILRSARAQLRRQGVILEDVDNPGEMEGEDHG